MIEARNRLSAERARQARRNARPRPMAPASACAGISIPPPIRPRPASSSSMAAIGSAIRASCSPMLADGVGAHGWSVAHAGLYARAGCDADADRRRDGTPRSTGSRRPGREHGIGGPVIVSRLVGGGAARRAAACPIRAWWRDSRFPASTSSAPIRDTYLNEALQAHRRRDAPALAAAAAGDAQAARHRLWHGGAAALRLGCAPLSRHARRRACARRRSCRWRATTTSPSSTICAGRTAIWCRLARSLAEGPTR